VSIDLDLLYIIHRWWVYEPSHYRVGGSLYSKTYFSSQSTIRAIIATGYRNFTLPHSWRRCQLRHPRSCSTPQEL